jgi:hypothetical protein
MSQDDVTDENSKARARDRGKPWGLENFEPGDQPFLGDMETVEGLVRSFGLGVIDVRKQFNAEQLQGVAAQHAVGALVARYATIFMGGAPEYRAMVWNSPGQLGLHLNKVMGWSEPEADAAAGYLWFIARSVLDVLVLGEKGTATEEHLQFRLDAMVEDAVYALLGLSMDKGDD